MTQTPTSLAIDWAEFRLGWRVLILALIGMATSVGVAPIYAFGTLVLPLQEAFGWSRGDIQSAAAFQYGSSIVAFQLAGWLNKRYGIRPVTLCSFITLPLAYLLMTFNGGALWQLNLGFGLLAFAGVGTLHVTWTQLTCLWFERNRGLALAAILCGTGMMALLLPPLLAGLIARFGWQAGFFALAALPLLFTLPMALAWMRLPTEVESMSSTERALATQLNGFSFRQALRSPVYWSFNVALILSVCLTVGMVTNIVPMLQSKGLSAQVASQIFSSFGISIIAGRLLVGYLLDRYPPVLVAVTSLALPAIGCAVFLFAGVQSTALLVFATLCVGVSAGAEFDLAAFLIARYFGLRDYARIFGLHLALVTVMSGLMPVFFGYLYEAYQGYSAVLLCCLACSLIGPSILLWLRPAAVVAVQATACLKRCANVRRACPSADTRSKQ